MAKVAIGHKRSIGKASKKASKLLFIDTDAKTTLIYSKHYFKKIPQVVQEIADTERFDLYLFTDIDIQWQADPQRDLGHRREEFKQRFMNELIKRNIPHVMIQGTGKRRLTKAIQAVNSFKRQFE